MQEVTRSPQGQGGVLSADELRKIDAYWRAANYLSVGQIYFYDNPLLREPLEVQHIKPRLLGHWGMPCLRHRRPRRRRLRAKRDEAGVC